MADFFTEETQTPTETPEIEKIKLGDKEYTQEELSGLVGVASKVQELESKYNTKFDKVWPEYGRSQNEVRTLKEELEKIKSQKPVDNNGEIDPEVTKQALEQARKIGLVTREDFKDFMRENFRDLYKVERETDTLVTELNRLEKDISGADGRPKFDKIAVLEHMKNEGFKDPMKAYKDMYEPQLDEWKTRQLSKARTSGFTTINQSSIGNKQPPEVKATRDNINQLVDEALDGNF